MSVQARSPSEIGPRYWTELHAWADRFQAELGGSCVCGEFAQTAARALHDVVNEHLGKPILYPDDLLLVAEIFQQACTSMNEGHERDVHVGNNDAVLSITDDRPTMAQALMGRAMAVMPREQRGVY